MSVGRCKRNSGKSLIKCCFVCVLFVCIYNVYYKTIPIDLNTLSDDGRHFHSQTISKKIFTTPLKPLTQNNSGSMNNSGIMIEDLSHTFTSLDKLIELLMKPWTKNQSNLVEFRKRMYVMKYDDLNLTEVMFASQSNMEPTEKYHTVFFYPRGKGHLTVERHELLPKKSPFTKRISSCSVVGNSGIMVNSSCGHNIDQAEFVFRFNLPPIQQFVNDAGSKSNITTVNPSIIRKRYSNFKTNASEMSFIRNLLKNNNHSYFWFPGFHEGGSTRISFAAAKIMSKDPRVAGRSLFGRPDHTIAVARFWNMTGIISSGFYMVNTALAMCDDVTLYGFWPFYTDHRHRNLQYHYYELMKLKRKTHSFSDEFKILLNLHTQGVLRLHIDTCT